MNYEYLQINFDDDAKEKTNIIYQNKNNKVFKYHKCIILNLHVLIILNDNFLFFKCYIHKYIILIFLSINIY